MLKVLFVIFAGLFIGDIIGYGLHRLLHWKRSGFMFQKHMTHHLKLYPTYNYMSAIYRSPGKDNSMYIFTAFIALACLSMLIFCPLWIALIFSAEFIFLGWLNDYFHDAFHITGHKLEKYNYFLNLRRLHYEHHLDMNKNYGIVSFIADRIFKSYIDPLEK